MMRELVGPCVCCAKDVYCTDGFLNGIVDEGKILCFDCQEKRKSDWDTKSIAEDEKGKCTDT
ncbi:hypothetical protein [Polycladomyces subterraneus]